MALKKRKLTQEELDQKVLYFAYGSNMHQPRLEQRVGKVKCIGTYKLPGYKLTFDVGTKFDCFANVDREDGETCEGVIYEMTYRQLRELDYYEGLYMRIKEEYEGRKLHIYISDLYRNARGRETELSMEYYAILMLGCKEHKLKKSLKIVEAMAPKPRIFAWKRETYYAEYWD